MKIFILACMAVAVMLTSCTQTEKNAEVTSDTAIQTDSLLERGDVITAALFDSLRTELMAAIADSGLSGAVQYCNIQAMPITQLMETQHSVSIRRATDKARNPVNSADEFEQGIIDSYRNMIGSDEAPVARIVAHEGLSHYVKPIFTMGLCLKCHGIGNESLDSLAHSTIQSIYPGDKAVGYVDKELRGIWHITFK